MLINNYLFRKIMLMRLKYKVVILVLSMLSSVSALIVPYYQKELLDYLSIKNTFNLSFTYLNFLLLIFVFAILAQIFTFLSKYLSQLEGGYLQTWLSNITYAKALRVKTDASNKISVGDSLAIYATDIHTTVTFVDDVFPNFISYLIPIILSPLAIYFIIGINPIPIFGLLILILTFNVILGIRQGKLFFNGKKFSGLRIGVVSEWIQNIRIIRMLGWIEGIEKKIKYYRENETLNRIKMVKNASIMNSIGYSAPFFINIFSVLLLIHFQGYSLTAGKIFSLFWLFAVLLTRPMRMIPIMFVSLSDCLTSMKRIQNYWEQELEEQEIDKEIEIENKESCSLIIKELSYFSANKYLLHDINLEFKPNEFVAIIGEYGSGKSLIIKALLNLINIKFSKFEINNKPIEHMSLSELRSYFSYVPQDFFVINSNLRDNVAFEYDYSLLNDRKVYNCLELSQFNCEQENLKQGLDSDIGERGVNLSGGQKQRILLARACYSDRPIILVDDCLSALDIKTQEKLIEELINGYWKNKIRILVTHKLSILSNCDRVLFIKDGKIVESGSFNEIIKNSETVRNFIANLPLQE